MACGGTGPITGALSNVNPRMDTMAVFILLWAAILALVAVPASGQEKAANTDSGQLLYNNACRTCHTLREGDNRLGPNLHRIIGRKAGSLADYGYSSSLKNADLVWDKGTLDRFIANPDQVVPGNNMKPYSGLTSAEDRAQIVAFLETSGAK
jgi:cytochrome c